MKQHQRRQLRTAAERNDIFQIASRKKTLDLLKLVNNTGGPRYLYFFFQEETRARLFSENPGDLFPKCQFVLIDVSVITRSQPTPLKKKGTVRITAQNDGFIEDEEAKERKVKEALRLALIGNESSSAT